MGSTTSKTNLLFTPCCGTRDTSPYHEGNIKEYPLAPTFGQQGTRAPQKQLSNAIFYGSTLHRKMQPQRRRRRRKKRIKRSER